MWFPGKSSYRAEHQIVVRLERAFGSMGNASNGLEESFTLSS